MNNIMNLDELESVTVSELRKNYSKISKQVSSSNKPIRVTKYGKTDSIIMSVTLYNGLVEMRDQLESTLKELTSSDIQATNS